MAARRGVSSPPWGALAFLLYLATSFAYLGLRPLLESGHQYVGYGYNPEIFIWSFAWWPHAILHGQNPFYTHAVWAPIGANTMWSTTVPGLALAFAPFTLLTDPIVTYDVAAVLMPALAAWCAFLLCRYLTASLWASLVGGYLFGFSSFVLAEGGVGGNLNLSTAFVVPLAALVVLRFLDGRLTGRGFVIRFGALVAFQFLVSVEVAFTLTIALVLALALGALFVPARRMRIVALVRPVAGAYLLAGLLVAPFLYYLLSAYPKGAFYAPDMFITDLANLVIPTKVTALGGGWLQDVSHRFPGNLGEQGAYVGLPALLIVVLYAKDRVRAPGGRFLVVAFLLAVLLTLGGKATVAGHVLMKTPWALLRSFSFYDNLLTARFAVYVALAVAVVVALWTGWRRAGLLRWLLPSLAVLAVVPNPRAGGFSSAYRLPEFFTGSVYSRCLGPSDNVLAFPSRGGWALLWQERRNFGFRLAVGDIGPDIPAAYLSPPSVVPITGGTPLDADNVAGLRELIASKGVTVIIADAQEASEWSGALDQIAPPHALGGVVVYRPGPARPGCRA
jgi:hypothetical protein